jgi:hypothetical protein
MVIPVVRHEFVEINIVFFANYINKLKRKGTVTHGYNTTLAPGPTVAFFKVSSQTLYGGGRSSE